MFAQKMNDLSVVLLVSSNVCQSPEVKESLKQLREAAGRQCDTVAEIAQIARHFADLFNELLDFLPEQPTDDETPLPILKVSYNAEAMLESCNLAMEGLEVFGQEIPPIVQRITVALGQGESICITGPLQTIKLLTEGSRSSPSPILTEENSQAVNDIIRGAKECTTLIHGVRRYCDEIKDHFRDAEPLKTNPPSEDEIKMERVRGKHEDPAT